MLIQLPMETNSLYHYCKLSTAIEFILPDKQLLLNPIGKTNDPRENKSFVFAGSNMNASDLSDPKDWSSNISQEIRRDCKILCFCGDRSPYFGYELSRMWALYGENHVGICIELNKHKFLMENRKKILHELFRPITYNPLNVNKPIVHREIDFERINKIGLKQYIQNEFRPQNIEYLFFTKNQEWASEQEYRAVYFSEDRGTEFCSIQNCIEKIYVGVDFNDHYLPAIKKTCGDVDIFKLEYRDERLITSFKIG